MLRSTIEGHAKIGLAEDVTAAVLERKRIEHERDHDILTGLYNRQAFNRVCTELFAAPERMGVAALMMMDLDNLKHINDTYGHTEGDNAISTVGRALMTSAIQGEVCSRFGGDEFTVAGVIADMDDNYFENFRERFREYLRQYNQISRKPYLVESSIGFCFQKLEDEIDLDQMIKIADDRMYEDKVQRRKARR